MKNSLLKRYVIGSVLVMSVLFGACKKNKTNPEPQPEPEVKENTKQTPTTNRTDLTNDSLFLYAKEIYFWNTALPTYDAFNPRQYSTTSGTDLVKYETNLYNLVKSSNSQDYLTDKPYPKYSYIFDQADKNPTASIPNTTLSVDLDGNGNDVGLRFGYFGNSDSDYSIYVTAVYPNSPAAEAGIARGDQVQEVNGVKYGTNFSSDVIQVENALEGASVTLKLLKAGVSTTKTLNKMVYKSNPIYKTTVFTAGDKKIGYLAYARFSNKENSETVLTTAFNDFATKGVTDLIVDLRYNGGGYISTAEHMVNLIAPSGTSGVMFTEHYNSTMQNKKATILKNQPLLSTGGAVIGTLFDDDYTISGNTTTFQKKGNLSGIKNVVFIVSKNTASASELVINSLKPIITVKLVGETTYGKPIGFFPITLENKYDVYLSMFETRNSKDEGGYYTGMIPNMKGYEFAADDKMYDFGNAKDDCTAVAINLLAPNVTVTGQAKVSATANRSTSTRLQAIGNRSGGEFVGMIENRK
ncbi:S41 family peptidase [Pedobacter foliorum]|uniref:S41 family peptidase n=1 Tax=Pedobacter foliorum TaxID=2739058 RepID=UPI001566942A|nr:S41 family peptidase [Pedobacter foliorum]NRF41463.1 PDZ domain-containing protein [Pedobacter foliorum]